MSLSADQLANILQSVDKTTIASRADRYRIQRAASGALKRLQSPVDLFVDQIWVQPAVVALIKTLIDAQFWSKWVNAGGNPTTSSGLAALASIDRVFLKRCLRLLASMDLLTESADGDTYGLTEFSRELADPTFAAPYGYHTSFNAPLTVNFPKFAAQIGYRNPTGLAETNVSSWLGEGQTCFGYFAAKPALNADFNCAMQTKSKYMTIWNELFPMDTLFAAPNPDRAIIVDVAGNVGHDLERIRAKYAGSGSSLHEGSLVLQDQPGVLETAKTTFPIVKQPIDLFKEQPSKGARAYYIHNVLHDWNDEDVVKILRNVAAAMERGYSRVFIHEQVLMPKDTSPWATISDIIMMISLSAMERTLEDWERVLSGAGLKLLKVWTKPEADASVLECGLE